MMKKIKITFFCYCATISCLVLFFLLPIEITNNEEKHMWTNTMTNPDFLTEDANQSHHRHELLPMFAFITQTEQCLPSHWLDEDHVGNTSTCDCHVYVLSYREQCNDINSSHIFYLHDTLVGWSGGRNVAYFEAKKHGYLYYIFFDDDVTLSYNAYTPQQAIDDRIPPLRIFTKYLAYHLPAAASIDFKRVSPVCQILDVWHEKCKKLQVPRAIPLYHFDALFNAFHKDVVGYLLPYYDKFDTVSYWLSQLHLCFTFQLVFYGRHEFLPYISVHNPSHRYSQTGHLDNMEIRKDMVENIRNRTVREYKNHSRFISMMDYDFRLLNTAAVICEYPPASRSQSVPYQRMKVPHIT